MKLVTNRTEKKDDNGNVRYSKINRDIHDNRNDGGYNYYNDRNFHGHIDNNYPTRNVTMNGSYMNSDGATAEKITNRVKNMKGVDRVSAVVYGDNVLIAVKPENRANESELKKDVRRAVKSYVRGRDVNVTVTDNMYNRVNDMSTRLRNGTVTNEMNKDINDLFQSMRTDYNRVTD
jgi:spore cortex protein